MGQDLSIFARFGVNAGRTALNIDPPVPKVTNYDERLSKLVDLYKLKNEDLDRFWDTFQKYDEDNTGKISFEKFCSNHLEDEVVIFHQFFLGLIEVQNFRIITFSEFVELALVVPNLNKNQVLRLCFLGFDLDGNELIDNNEIANMASNMVYNGYTLSAKRLLHMADYKDSGCIDYNSFLRFNELYPEYLFPAFKFQDRLIFNILGMSWFNAKKVELAMDRIAEKEKIEREINTWKWNERKRQWTIMKAMGFYHYFTRPEERNMLDDYFPPEPHPHPDEEERQRREKELKKIEAQKRREAAMKELLAAGGYDEEEEEKGEERQKGEEEVERHEKENENPEKRKKEEKTTLVKPNISPVKKIVNTYDEIPELKPVVKIQPKKFRPRKGKSASSISTVAVGG